MAETTGIEWCDATFNPWWGCERVSPGCAHCYAETLAKRYGHAATWPGRGNKRSGPEPHGFRFFGDDHWKKPLRWARLATEGKLPNGKPNRDGHRPRVFCASMADVFEERDELIVPRARLFDLIDETPELDWLILTKRPEFAREWLRQWWDLYLEKQSYPQRDDLGWGCPPNVWMGVSIENARHTWRADVLREIPAAVRFISAEPLLGSLFEQPTRAAVRANREASNAVVRMFIEDGYEPDDSSRYVREVEAKSVNRSKRPLDLAGIDWVIVGGESGPGARPMHPDWAREIRDACLGLEINSNSPRSAFFFKQAGTMLAREWGCKDKKGGNIDEIPADLRIREFPKEAAVAV